MPTSGSTPMSIPKSSGRPGAVQVVDFSGDFGVCALDEQGELVFAHFRVGRAFVGVEFSDRALRQRLGVRGEPAGMSTRMLRRFPSGACPRPLPAVVHFKRGDAERRVAGGLGEERRHRAGVEAAGFDARAGFEVVFFDAERRARARARARTRHRGLQSRTTSRRHPTIAFGVTRCLRKPSSSVTSSKSFTRFAAPYA